MIDLRPDLLQVVADILARHVPGLEVRAFGSRARWTAKEHSDLDLVIMSDAPMPLETLARLEEAFGESDLPMRVEVLDWATLGDNFRRIIEQGYEVMQKASGNRGMASYWTVSMLSDAPLEIIDGDRGINYPKQADFHSIGHCLFLNAGNVTSTGFDFSDCAFITAEKDAILRKGKLNRYDAVLTTRGTVGNIAYYDDSVPFEHIRINSGMVIFRVRTSDLLPRYLYLFVRSSLFRAQADALQTGSAQPQLPIRDINKIRIPIPPLNEQRAIAYILGMLDDKIELNRRMNQTLEAMAQALFKSWFVDFDPVRAKAEGRDTGLPAHIAELFPDSFDDSELGEIPQGWRAGTLKELTVKIGSGATPRGGKEVYVEEGIAFIRSQNVYDSEFVWDGLAYITAKQADDLTNVEVAKGDVLMNITGASILRTCIVQPSVLPARVNQHVAIIRAKPGIPNRFLHIHLLQKSTKDYLLGMNAGASREAVTKGHIESVPILVPAPTVLNRFENLTDAWSRKIERNTAEIRNLTALRNMLLPKLLSGACGAGIDWSFARG